MQNMFYFLFDVSENCGVDKSIQESFKGLLRRCVAGILIFFIPTVIGVFTNAVASFTKIKDAYDRMESCLISPFKKCTINKTSYCCDDGTKVKDKSECNNK